MAANIRPEIQVKRHGSFEFFVTSSVINFTGKDVWARIKDAGGAKYNFSVEIISANKLRVYAGPDVTGALPIGRILFDVAYAEPGGDPQYLPYNSNICVQVIESPSGSL